LIRIISIPTLSDFDRVRSQFQKLKTDGYKLTLDMAHVIETRTRELFNNHIKSNISVDDADVVAPSNKRVEELEQQLAEMKALLLQMNASNQNVKVDESKSTAKTEEEKPTVKPVKKSPGRPRKN
jgi:hypothetical protein